MNKQTDIITDLLIDFDEMGFVPTTAVPDHDAYAIEWRNKMTDAIKGYRTDVAREIFAEIDKELSEDEQDFERLAKLYQDEVHDYARIYVDDLRERFADLKKKYESEGADDE